MYQKPSFIELSSLLYVHDSREHDAGVYSCIFISPAGLAISSARVLFEKKEVLEDQPKVDQKYESAQVTTSFSNLNEKASGKKCAKFL